MLLEFLITIQDSRENIVAALRAADPDIPDERVDQLLKPDSALEYNDLGGRYQHDHECELVSCQKEQTDG